MRKAAIAGRAQYRLTDGARVNPSQAKDQPSG